MSQHKIVFFDTWLIITKVWFEMVFDSCPEWINNFIKTAQITGFILNDIDLPWIADPLRENGGGKRKELHSIYQKYLNEFNFRYVLNNGIGESRFKNAVRLIEENFL